MLIVLLTPLQIQIKKLEGAGMVRERNSAPAWGDGAFYFAHGIVVVGHDVEAMSHRLLEK
jgi:hypothetical protein